MKISFFLFLSILNVFSKVFFKEDFSGDKVFDRWIQSESKPDLGKFVLAAPKLSENIGLKTSQDAKFYGISTKFDEFSNKDKKLIIQLSVKHEQSIDCGGGYVKIFGKDVEPKKFHGESPYNIMFGPDICGVGTKKVHVIFSYKGKNFLVKKDISCPDDELTHLYKLVILPTNEYEVYVDNSKVESGKIEDDFDILPPKMINDPNESKPKDWVDEPEIDDPEDKKPEDWDVPKTIKDESAKKPEDWDDEMDGEWEAPMKDNPAYKGEWKPKKISNPAYKGPWSHPQISNPEYKEDKNLYSYLSFAGVGIDIWQVKSGSIFDNIIIADNEEEVEKFTNEWKKIIEKEKELKKEADLKAEEEAKKMTEKQKLEEKEKKESDEPKSSDDKVETIKDSDDEGSHDEL